MCVCRHACSFLIPVELLASLLSLNLQKKKKKKIFHSSLSAFPFFMHNGGFSPADTSLPSSAGDKNPLFTDTHTHSHRHTWKHRVLWVTAEISSTCVFGRSGTASLWCVFQAWQWAAAELTALQTNTRSLCLLCLCVCVFWLCLSLADVLEYLRFDWNCLYLCIPLKISSEVSVFKEIFRHFGKYIYSFSWQAWNESIDVWYLIAVRWKYVTWASSR